MSNILCCHGYTTKNVIMNGIKKLKKLIYTNNSLAYYYSVLSAKGSFSILLWFPVTKKIAAYKSEIRFDPSIPDFGDPAIPHAIVSVNKLFKLFYTIHSDIYCSISMTK
jgi:hypothetical protein